MVPETPFQLEFLYKISTPSEMKTIVILLVASAVFFVASSEVTARNAISLRETDSSSCNFHTKLFLRVCDLLNYQDAKALSYALKALSIKPDDGKSYMLIGNMYAECAESCGGSDEIAVIATYWAAVDKFERAVIVEPKVADEAKKKIEVYTSKFPSREKLLLADMKEGKTYTISCWIGETTSVRASN